VNRSPRINPRPCSTGPYLPVGQGHRLWWQVFGPAQGDPWLVLHGGPGSASHPGLAAPFDLERQQVVLYDQRGCGRSRPQGGVRHNRLGALVNDIEALRLHLGVERWSVLGGSWGATLALAYAAAHPASVERLVLRGAFDASGTVVRRLFARHWNGPANAHPSQANGHLAARPLFHRLSQLFRNGTPAATVRHLARQWEAMETRAALRGVQRSVRALQHSTPETAELSAQRTLSARLSRQLQRQARRQTVGHTTPSDRALQAKFSVQAHYLKHGGFMAPTVWQQQLRRIAQAGIPCHWVHGTLDGVCPIRTSQQGHARLNRWHPGLSTFSAVVAGHLGIEAPIARALHTAVRARP
jgi:proline iminopeptidase